MGEGGGPRSSKKSLQWSWNYGHVSKWWDPHAYRMTHIDHTTQQRLDRGNGHCHISGPSICSSFPFSFGVYLEIPIWGTFFFFHFWFFLFKVISLVSSGNIPLNQSYPSPSFIIMFIYSQEKLLIIFFFLWLLPWWRRLSQIFGLISSRICLFHNANQTPV